MDDREKILKYYCEVDAEFYNPICVHPCTWCSKHTGIPLSRVRRIARGLEKEGYIKKDFEGGYSDWSEKIFCIHGYTLTEKGRELDYYKEAYEKNCRELEEAGNRAAQELAEAMRAQELEEARRAQENAGRE